jgi:hypothetical protein
MLSLSLANRKAEEQGANSVLLDRGRGNPRYTFTSTFALTDVLTLAPGGALYKYIGLVGGYPFQLQASRTQGEEKMSLGIFVNLLVPNWRTEKWEGGLRHSLNLEVTLWAGELRRSRPFQYCFIEKSSRGYPNVFKKSGSIFFYAVQKC